MSRGRRCLPGALLLCGAASSCMALTPQLSPTRAADLEGIASRAERERVYADNMVHRHHEAAGVRYTKGRDPYAPTRTWQSLDAVLRSERNSAAALPYRHLRLSKVFTVLSLMSALGVVAGAAGSAREGLDLENMNGPSLLLVGSGAAALAFAVTAGVLYGKARGGYDRAVDVYNESLGLRLGLHTREGDYIPPPGAVVDQQGFMELEEPDPALEPVLPEGEESGAQENPAERPGPGDPGGESEVQEGEERLPAPVEPSP